MLTGCTCVCPPTHRSCKSSNGSQSTLYSKIGKYIWTIILLANHYRIKIEYKYVKLKCIIFVIIYALLIQ